MIEISGLHKAYDDTVALEELNLTLAPGDVFGFIGPNGAGKTTTLRILATLLTPSGGSAKIDGKDVVRERGAVRKLIGYMPDFFGLYDDLTVREVLDFFAAAYRVPRARRKTLVDEVLALTDLTGKADALVEGLSRGMTQRLGLAKTLIHDPAVLLLDEPASGLDPRARIEMRELLRELQRMGKTIMLSSHILPELADVCTKVGILHRGRLAAFGTVEELAKRASAPARVRVRVAGDAGAARAVLAAVPGVKAVEAGDGGGELGLTLDGPAVDVSELMLAALTRGVKLTSFTPERPDLEELFLTITGGEA